MQPKPFLRVVKRVGEVEENITKVELGESISAGIKLGAIGEGMVPIFEEHSARLERGYSLEQWYALAPMERAIVIAVRRIDVATKNHQQEAEARHVKRGMKKGKR